MAQSLVMAGEILRAAHVMACSAPRSIHKNRRGSRWGASRSVAIETMRLGGIAHNFLGLIGSVVAAVLSTTRDIYEPTVYLIWGKREKLSSTAAPWVKTAKAVLQATGCAAGGSSYCTRRPARIRLRDQIESKDSRSCGPTTVPSAVAARAPAGNCSTVARWPLHRRVTSTTCPSGNSNAS